MDRRNITELDRLKWSLQALALDADAQVRLFPSFVWVGDELAQDFDDSYRVTNQNHQFGPEQISALSSVDAVLSKMTEERNMDLWEEGTALSRYPQWQEVRECARTALKTLGWNLEAPPKDRGIYYVGPPNQ